MSNSLEEKKKSVSDFWEAQACGEVYAQGRDQATKFASHAVARYALEPYILPFARFGEAEGKSVLEIGVGFGADHCEWARCGPKRLAGIDLTDRAIQATQARVASMGLQSELQVADAENLPFPDESFDIVYSWGVLHHSPDTPRAIDEVWRVLRDGGTARVMIYQRSSIIGALLWLRYAAFRGKSLDWVYAHYLESPGTKAYSIAETRKMFARFSAVRPSSVLSAGDLFEGAAGQRHTGALLSVARAIWPRKFIRRHLHRFGLFLLVDAVK